VRELLAAGLKRSGLAILEDVPGWGKSSSCCKQNPYSTDGWTSEEGTNYVAVVAHFLGVFPTILFWGFFSNNFLDENHRLQTTLFDLPPLKSPHLGPENLTKILYDVIDSYDISAALGFLWWITLPITIRALRVSKAVPQGSVPKPSSVRRPYVEYHRQRAPLGKGYQ